MDTLEQVLIDYHKRHGLGYRLARQCPKQKQLRCLQETCDGCDIFKPIKQGQLNEAVGLWVYRRD